ncbi:MAG: hypothetical protein IJ056_05125 [Acidaminococcaceae bacterium]|nr:hypothetical protein [Acidaminococcaceae bacterium]MBQ9320317.1 hypothetical protein [Acidaminococcaceae bacterium]MBQ9697595.1 hypothetical protein [Acidaminococcaceae bacterium]
MEYYKTLLARISELPSSATFTMGQAYGEGWREIPAKEKIEMGRKLKKDVLADRIPDVVSNGTIPGSVHPHKFYKKL